MLFRSTSSPDPQRIGRRRDHGASKPRSPRAVKRELSGLHQPNKLWEFGHHAARDHTCKGDTLRTKLPGGRFRSRLQCTGPGLADRRVTRTEQSRRRSSGPVGLLCISKIVGSSLAEPLAPPILHPSAPSSSSLASRSPNHSDPTLAGVGRRSKQQLAPVGREGRCRKAGTQTLRGCFLP